MDLRLVAYRPNGDPLGLLPHPLSLEVGWPLGDVPSLRVGYSRDVIGGDHLNNPVELAVECSTDDGVTWVEPPDSRFVLIKRRGDQADKTDTWAFDLPGWSWMFRKVVLYPGDESRLVDGKRPFLSATPGEILQTYLAEGQARGVLPGLTWDFTATHDSAGQEWAKILTIYYEPGLDSLTALINLAEQGVLDWRMERRVLRAFNTDTVLARRLADGPAPVDLRLGRDVTGAPDEGTLEDAASSVLVVGDNGLRVELDNDNAVKPWGRWEQYIGHGGVSDEGTATILAQSALERAERERIQRTRGITPHTARWLPWRDYRPGDYILAPSEDRELEPLRVRQITLHRDNAGTIGGNLVLHDRFLDRAVRLARRTAGIVGGSTADGGSGARPAPPDPIPRTPAAPEGLIVDTVAYIDANGLPQGQITATWGHVTHDVDGVAVNISGYELYGRRNIAGAPWFSIASTDAGDNNVTHSPLPINQEWTFKVRAINQGVKGEWSTVVAVTIADDADPPPAPSTPQLATRLGVVHVTWDGRASDGSTMPSDLHKIRIWMQDPLNPGAEEIGYLQEPGAIVVPGLPYSADREFWFTAVDRSGNESPASAAALIATEPVVGDDITAGAITANQLAVGAVQASHIASAAVQADKLAAVLALVTRIVAGDPDGARVELNTRGLQAFDASGDPTVDIDAATGAASIVGQFASGVVGNRVVINPAGAVLPEIRWYPGTGANSARIYTDAEASIISESGTSSDGSRYSETIQRGDEWRMHIRQASDGLAGGGYMFALPDRLEVGYNDSDGNLNRFLFDNTGSDGAIKVKGVWDFEHQPGLMMLDRDAINVTSLDIEWYTVLQSTPRLVFSVDNPTPNNATFYMTNPGTSGVTIHSSSSGTFTAKIHVWAWRQWGVP